MKGELNEILFKVSEALDVPVKFSDGSDMKVNPAFDVNAMISKFVGLLVFAGVDVPSAFAPSYMRVHADVDFWKRHFEALEVEAGKRAEASAGEGAAPAAEAPPAPPEKTEEPPAGG